MRLFTIILTLGICFIAVSAMAEDCPTGFEMVDGECRFVIPEDDDGLDPHAPDVTTVVTNTTRERDVITPDERHTVIVESTTVDRVSIEPYRVLGKTWNSAAKACARMWEIGVNPSHVVMKDGKYLAYERPQIGSMADRFYGHSSCLRPADEPEPEPEVETLEASALVYYLVSIYDSVILFLESFAFIEQSVVDNLVREREELLEMVEG